MRKFYSDSPVGQIHFRHWPCQGKATLPPLICLHPSPYSGSYFETLAPQLTQGRNVYTPDYPGYGGSDNFSQKPSITEIATALITALEAASLLAGPVTLLGFHTGCLVAAEISLLRPELCAHILLIDVPYYTAEQQAERYPLVVTEAGYDWSLESMAKAWQFSVAKREGSMVYGRALGNFIAQISAGEQGSWSFHAAFTYDCVGRFAAITAPATIIATKSMLHDPSLIAAEAIPHATLVERVDITRAVMEEGAGKIAELANAILCGEKASSLGSGFIN